MPDNALSASTVIVPLTADIVSAYVSNHRVDPVELPALIATVHGALNHIQSAEPVKHVGELTPAVSLRKSLSNPDKIISMIDGKPYSSLTRHLSTQGITPAGYRERYKLPADYPMVAPGYSARRSLLAKALGLGRKAVAGVIGTAAVAVSATLTALPSDAESLAEASSPSAEGSAPQPAQVIAEPRNGLSEDDVDATIRDSTIELPDASEETVVPAKSKRGRS
jgi:predicted transcriptional regulator